MISCIGLDLITGEPRFTYDVEELLDGVGMVPIMMGLFGISEILTNLEAEAAHGHIGGPYFPSLPQSAGLEGFYKTDSARDSAWVSS